LKIYLKYTKKETTKSIFSKQVEHEGCCFFSFKIRLLATKVKCGSGVESGSWGRTATFNSGASGYSIREQ